MHCIFKHQAFLSPTIIKKKLCKILAGLIYQFPVPVTSVLALPDVMPPANSLPYQIFCLYILPPLDGRIYILCMCHSVISLEKTFSFFTQNNFSFDCRINKKMAYF